MCLDHGTFLLIRGEEEIPLQDVASIVPGAGVVRLIDVFGKSRELAGTVDEIDFLNRRIILAA